jgi:hypothetical protein
MGRRCGFLPPPVCQECAKPPNLGQSLWPGEKWRCIMCLEAALAGKDTVSKSMAKTVHYANEMKETFELEAEGSKAEGPRNRAEWAGMMAAAIRKEGVARVKEVAMGNGEVIPPRTEKLLYDTMSTPSLAAVEASLARSRLLLDNVADVVAMALDAADSIGATNSLEKMLAHQLAAAHKVVMEQMGSIPHKHNPGISAKRLMPRLGAWPLTNKAYWYCTR